MSRRLSWGFAAVVGGITLAGGLVAASHEPHQAMILKSENPSGQLRTLNMNGELDLNNPFFQDLGSNGRRCSTCHLPDEGWTITPEGVQRRFQRTRGLDPIFRTNDGSNCEGADISTTAKRRRAFSLLLERGVIRVSIDVPTQTNDVPSKPAEFEIVSVDDPYDCAGSDLVPIRAASMYRRPLPTSNFSFLSAVMWDGREPDLAHQSNSATLGHAQAAVPLSTAEQNAIVEFEKGLFTAQARDRRAGSLHARGATGGPEHLSNQEFFFGINDPIGMNPTSAPFDPQAFSLFGAWASLDEQGPVAEARRSIARGEELFNTTPLIISGVAGLNDQTFQTPSGPVTVPSVVFGSCTVCHDSPNVGHHSVKAPLNIGIADASRRTPDLPLYTLKKINSPETVQTTDPGRAMVTGKWADIGKFKGPVLRGLASRAPYFHDGSAKTLEEVLDFYAMRFRLGLSAQDRTDLIAFLNAL